MGTKKTKLTRGDRFGLLKATELAAEMIGNYDRARDGALELRIESIEDADWDDVVVVKTGVVDKWQVKRLMDKFSVDDLAALINSAMVADKSSLHFGVAAFVPVVRGSTQVCSLQKLAELCAEAQKPGVVGDDLLKREKSNAALLAITNALPDASTHDIFALLRRFEVVPLGIEKNLLDNAIGHLEDIFVNAEDLVKRLHGWILQHNDGVIAITPSLLYEEIIDEFGRRDIARQTWIHLSRDVSTLDWELRGTLSLDKLVAHAWGEKGARVQLGVTPFVGEATSASLSRLLLHRTAHSAVEVAMINASEWMVSSMRLCGGTLGNSTEPLEFTNRTLDHNPAGPARGVRSDRDLSALISQQMNELVWEEFRREVARRLLEDSLASDLREPMKQLWQTWNQELADQAAHVRFMRSMLSTAEEWDRTGFEPLVRTGRTQVHGLAAAAIIALAVGVALSPAGSHATIHTAGGIENMRLGSTLAHVMALRAASSPKDRRPMLLSDAPGAILSLEPSLTVLGLVDASASDLYHVASAESAPYHASEVASQSYRHVGMPFPVLTASPVLRAAMRGGLQNLKQHLQDVLHAMERLRKDNLSAVMDEAAT